MTEEHNEQPYESEPTTDGSFFKKTRDRVVSTGRVVAKQSGAIASTAGKTSERLLGKASESAKRTAGAVGDGMDVISGKRLLELVEQRLELQAQYNDILATKLEEALQRIAALERKAQQ